jgi:hypothetical protein
METFPESTMTIEKESKKCLAARFVFPALLGLSTGLFGALTLADFAAPGEVSRFVVSNATATGVTGALGPSMRVVSLPGGPHPSVQLTNLVGWDLSAFGEFTFRVTNLDATSLTVLCRVRGPHKNFPVTVANTYALTLQGHTAGALRVSLTPTLLSNLYQPTDFLVGGVNMQGAGPRAVGGVTPGTAFGDVPAALDKYTEITFYTISSTTRVARYEIGNLSATGAPGSFPVAAFPFIDRFGQFIHKDWTDKVHCEEELVWLREQETNDLATHAKPSSWDAWGGWQDGPTRAATGSFRTEKVGGKWYFVDPDGRLFFSHGFNCVYDGNWTQETGRGAWFAEKPAYSAEFYNSTGLNFFRYALKLKYGASYTAEFADTTLKRLPSWGFNTIGNWSQDTIYNRRKVPYTATLSTSAAVRLTSQSGAAPASFPDVWNASFSNELVNQFLSAKLNPSLNDPWCIGYFVDNELPLGVSTSVPETGVVAAQVVQAYDALRGNSSQAAKIALVNDLQAKYADISALNAQWGSSYGSWADVLALSPPNYQAGMYADLYAFTRKTADKYYGTISNVLKAHAPNRLYLGSRFAYVTGPFVAAAGRFCDVVSFNVYTKHWTNSTSIRMQYAGDKPYLIGEYHFGSLDRGSFTAGLVPSWNQAGRALSYSDYVIGALTNNNLVGCHWFQYGDQPVTGRWHDGENRQCGFIDNCDTPYVEMVAASREIGKTMYSVRYNAGLSPDLIPPVVTGAPAGFLTNKAFTVNLAVDKDSGYWSTNGASFQAFSAPGTSLVIGGNTTLRVYGASNGVTGPTNSFVYAFDTVAPVVTGMATNLVTNRGFSLTLGVAENYGYWSTNGSPFASFTTAGVSLAIARTTVLRAYGRDALGNTSATNAATYSIVDTNAPTVGGAPTNLFSSNSFTVNLTVDEEDGWWSTNGSPYVSFSTQGVAIPIGRTTTLAYFGLDAAGNCSATNVRTYTVLADTAAPVVSVSPSSGVFSGPVLASLSVNEEYGYWSTNGGQSWAPFGPAGARVACSNNVTLLAFGRDAAGNQSATNQFVYAIVPQIKRFSLALLARNGVVRLSVEADAPSSGGFELFYDYRQEGGSEWIPIPASQLLPTGFAAVGEILMSDWRPVSLNTRARYSFRVRAGIGPVRGSEYVLPRVDLSGLGILADNLDRVTLLNHPWRGEGEGVVIVNLTRDSSSRVFTLSGRLLADLPMPSEQGRTVWNVRDRSGKRLPPGNYLASIKCPTGEKTLVVMVLP